MNMPMVRLEDIDVLDRLRDVDAERVEQLAQSIKDVGGLISPIEVSPADEDGRRRLIAGAHRVAAAKLAGLAEVPFVEFEGDEDKRRLREIDENLYRHELSAFDEASFLAERREIFERINGKVTRGRPKKADRDNSAKAAELSFFDEVTQRFRFSRRRIERAMTRRNQICQEAWRQLRPKASALKGIDLDCLIGLDDEQQLDIVEQFLNWLAEGKSKSLVAAKKEVLGNERQHDPATFLDKTKRAFERLTPSAKREFCDWLVKNGHFGKRAA